jgi:3-deoxy-7-phosphoheptulonate synthase
MKLTGKQTPDVHGFEFTYQGLRFSQNSFHIFAGLNAVDNRSNVGEMMRRLQDNNLVCTRMGAYKPRTSAYSFQGHGAECLPYVFELAGKFGIRIIAMEVTHERQINEINQALQQSGSPCGVMLQIGTRNAQNFELLKAVGQQETHPVLYKRGYGITLDESLHAAEYIASSGNNKIILCLRGVKTILGNPHRNLVDFSHVPVVKSLSKLPVAIDPSHSVGTNVTASDNISDVFHASAQGVISGANLALVDFHPSPEHALVDSRQAINSNQLQWFAEDMHIARMAYLKRQQLAIRQKVKKHEQITQPV